MACAIHNHKYLRFSEHDLHMRIRSKRPFSQGQNGNIKNVVIDKHYLILKVKKKFSFIFNLIEKIVFTVNPAKL